MQDSTFDEGLADVRPESAKYVEAEHGVGQGANQPDGAARLHQRGQVRDAARDDTGKQGGHLDHRERLEPHLSGQERLVLDTERYADEQLVARLSSR